jgi:hypothetical protein
VNVDEVHEPRSRRRRRRFPCRMSRASTRTRVPAHSGRLSDCDILPPQCRNRSPSQSRFLLAEEWSPTWRHGSGACPNRHSELAERSFGRAVAIDERIVGVSALRLELDARAPDSSPTMSQLSSSQRSRAVGARRITDVHDGVEVGEVPARPIRSPARRNRGPPKYDFGGRRDRALLAAIRAGSRGRNVLPVNTPAAGRDRDGVLARVPLPRARPAVPTE